ncbi:MAG TPA: DUF6714 family protein [Kofleriaceae bacterium]|nr:DUF6714 family protein [Kofleriaceae bacterium]
MNVAYRWEAKAGMEDDARSIDIEIRIAFAEVMRPVSLARDRRLEIEAMDRDLGAKVWTELSADELMRHRRALALLDGAAFRYYLPAYLLASLDETRPSFRQELREATLIALSPYQRSHGPHPIDGSLFEERTAALDLLQRGVIRRYIRYVRTRVTRARTFPALDIDGVWR